MMIYIFKDEFPVIDFNSLFMFMPVNIHIPYRNLMIKICSTNFSRKCISRIIVNLEMPVDASVVGINPAVVPFAEKAFTFLLSEQELIVNYIVFHLLENTNQGFTLLGCLISFQNCYILCSVKAYGLYLRLFQFEVEFFHLKIPHSSSVS